MSDPNPHDSGDEDNNNDVFIDESDIVHEVAFDDEVLPDADGNDAGGDGDGDGSSSLDPDGMNFGPVWIDLLEFIYSHKFCETVSENLQKISNFFS
jgi:hypothetical protein